MSPVRFDALTASYSALRLAIVGDFCLDRYLEIDPAKTETSLETGRPVHNVVRVRSQPGAAGTILNNLVALGIGVIWPVGFCGADGEGFELQRALGAMTNVRLDHFLQTDARRTFTYCKPLVVAPGQVPVELNRLDSKNWTPTPLEVSDRLAAGLEALSAQVDAVILMDQVDLPDTGVVTQRLLETVGRMAARRPELPVLADSRRGLRGFPPVILKMNARELAVLTGTNTEADIASLKPIAATLARRHGRMVFVTLAERGIVGATPDGKAEHVPALSLRGPIDIVGAGDAVTANLTAALAAGGTLREAMELAMTAASIILHQLGTTGTASVAQVKELAVPAS
ncbi:MAG: PfkB family carbohydrate kinase [Verrucomicrobiota bacterium]|jgi:rfaE bifunctional protein kinase chain/domain